MAGNRVSVEDDNVSGVVRSKTAKLWKEKSLKEGVSGNGAALLCQNGAEVLCWEEAGLLWLTIREESLNGVGQGPHADILCPG